MANPLNVNYLLMPARTADEQLSVELGFPKTLFLGRDFVEIEGKPKDILTKSAAAKNKKCFSIYKPTSSEMLRFAVEKTPINIIYGLESIHTKDSLHYPRSGLDQVLCKIIKEQEKSVGFSFAEILHSTQRSHLLTRIAFNLKLCRKYKINVIFSNFSREKMEMRSAKDLQAFRNVLEKLS